jgi:superfamily II DNA helicase RecQ
MPPAQKTAVYVLMQKDMQRRIQVLSEKSADAPAAATRSPSEEGIERAETFVQTKLDRRCPISDALYQRDALVSAAISGEDQILMWATGMGKTMAALGIAVLMKGLVTFVLPLATLRDEVFYGRALALLEAAKLAGVRVEWACLDDKVRVSCTLVGSVDNAFSP